MLIDRVQPVDVASTGFVNAIDFTQTYSHQLNIRLSVRETYTGLETWIQFDCRPGVDGKKPHKVYVGPSKLAVWLTSRRGLVSCKRLQSMSAHVPESSVKKDCAWSGPIPLREVREAIAEQRTIHLYEKAINILKYKDASSVVAAIASTTELDPQYSIFLVEKECLSCCMEAVLAVDRPERSDFCIFQLPQ